MSKVANMPPTLPLGCTVPQYARGERTKTCVCTGGALRVCGPCHWREMAVSNLTRESAHSACVPGSESPQQAYPGGGDDGYPQGQESVGARGVPERGNTFAGDVSVSVTRRKHVCQGRPRAGRPLPTAPPKLSSAVGESRELPESGVNLGHGSGNPAPK